MRILYFWRKGNLEVRNTTKDYIHSFQKYDMENEYFYFNIWRGRYESDYAWLKEGMFDAIIFDNTATALRTAESHWNGFVHLMSKIKNYHCLKLIFVQDDYTKSNGVWALANAIKADAIFTVLREQDIDKIYEGHLNGNIALQHVLTGYVEEGSMEGRTLSRHKKRPLDVVYRAKRLPYHFGRQGQLKYEVGEKVKLALKNTDLHYDINATGDSEGVLYGDAWIDFLASSRTVIGCLSGAGLADYDGVLSRKVKEYMQKYPKADYDEVKKNCFPEREENLTGALSPRVFEATLTKTCQILVGEDYHGIFRPNIDYIVLNEDFSNMDQVLDKIKDVDYCEAIAETCYDHIVKPGHWSYRYFVRQIVDWIEKHLQEKTVMSKEISTYIQKCCDRNNKQVDREMLEFFK